MNKMQKYVIEAVMFMFLLLFIFWAVGYFANAIYGMKFELQSCWSGIAAIGSAGVLAAIKYIMDSWRNSPVGQQPYNANNNGSRAIDELSQSLCTSAMEKQYQQYYGNDSKQDGKEGK